MTGLVFNGVAVLGLAAEGVDQVTIHGDVQLHVQPLLSRRSVTQLTCFDSPCMSDET